MTGTTGTRYGYGQPPPPANNLTPNGPGRYEEFLNMVRAQDGEWMFMVLPKSSSSIGTMIKKGKVRGAAEGEFDACSRKVGNTHRLYARWLWRR